MELFLTISGWVLTALGLAYAVISHHQQSMERAAMNAREQQLAHLKLSLTHLNQMLNEAEQRGDTEKPEVMRRFVTDLAHSGRSMEHEVDLMLGHLVVAHAPSEPQPFPHRWLRRLFPMMRR